MKVAQQLGPWRPPSGPLAEALVGAVREAVLDGRIPAGSRLPSERALAQALEVSRGTVVSALTGLRDQGWVATRHGSGSVVQLPPRLTARTTPWSFDHGLVPGPGLRPDLDLTYAVTAAPHEAYLAALQRAVEVVPGLLIGSGTANSGLPRLRELLAQRYTDQGLPTRPEQILVTSGAQAALSLLVAQLHPGPRTPVLVENATYPAALATLRQARAALVTVRVTAESGWDVEHLASTVRNSGARLAYLVPDFHNPTGAHMDRPTRTAIADLAARHRMTVIVDETMRDLDLREPPSGRPQPGEPHLAGPGIIQIGSTSKTIWSGLRVGWIRATAELVDELQRNPLQGLLSPPPFEQQVAVELLGPALPAILADRRRQLREQRDHLARLLDENGWDYPLPPGGLSIWLHLGAAATARQVVTRAARHGLALSPGPMFAADRSTFVHHLRLPFTATPDLLTRTVARLREVMT
jgi:DNA-binding transcriptional MocR family regulator